MPIIIIHRDRQQNICKWHWLRAQRRLIPTILPHLSPDLLCLAVSILPPSQLYLGVNIVYPRPPMFTSPLLFFSFILRGASICPTAFDIVTATDIRHHFHPRDLRQFLHHP